MAAPGARAAPGDQRTSAGALSGELPRASAHLVLNFRNPGPRSPLGVLVNATPRRSAVILALIMMSVPRATFGQAQSQPAAVAAEHHAKRVKERERVNNCQK
jgi:hypothetical protein